MSNWTPWRRFAAELAETGLLGPAVRLVEDLQVLAHIGVDRLEAVGAQATEALVAHLGVDLAEPVPLEDGQRMPAQGLGRGSRRGGARIGAPQQEEDNRGAKDAGDRRPAHHQTSDESSRSDPDSSAARPGC
jgi:hypothetical protein